MEKSKLTILYVLIGLLTPTQSPMVAGAADLLFEFSETPSGDNFPDGIAVAFHSITFIDSLARPIDEVIVGTDDANALQGEGWSENGEWPVIGTFQWAGGAEKRATIQLTIPEGAEGLLLSVRSVKDSLWMTVTIDGELAADLRVDAYWHSGYVPVGNPRIESALDAEPEWTEGRYFPQFPPTDHLYVLRVRCPIGQIGGAWEPEWRIDQSHEIMISLTLVGMQGVINRTGPRVYIHWLDSTGHFPEDISGIWIPELKKSVEVSLDLDGLSAVNFLMRCFAPRFGGSVVYDPKLPDTINLATMIAGLENRIILAPEQLELPGILTLESVTDLGALAQENGWDDTEDGQLQIYQWAYDNLWQSQEHRMIALISPGPPTSREFPPGLYWPMGMASRNYYLIALKLPALYLHPVDAQQSTLLESFIDDAPSPIPILGGFAAFEEGVTVIASRYGDWQAVFPWPGNPVSTGNLSVFSGVQREAIQYQAQIDEGRILAALGDRPVASMITTDGDAIFYNMSRGFSPQFGWDDVQNQLFGWTINATLAELATTIWNYYVESRSEVSLVAAIQGAGYVYIDDMNDTQLGEYLSYASRYLGATGLRTVNIFSPGVTSWTADNAARYYDTLNDVGYLGVVLDTVLRLLEEDQASTMPVYPHPWPTFPTVS